MDGCRILAALLRPRGAPVPASMLINCLVSAVPSNGGGGGVTEAYANTTGGIVFSTQIDYSASEGGFLGCAE